VKSHDILERNRRGWVVNEKDAMGPSQIPEEASVSNERDRSYPLLPITLSKNIAWPLDDIQDKDTIISQPHGFLVGSWK
jgi:hypothetical protein